MSRSQLAQATEALGEAINVLREQLLKAKYVFLAGIIRGAEEIVLVVFNLLSDPAVPDGDL